MISDQDALKLKRMRKQLKKDLQKAKKKLMSDLPPGRGSQRASGRDQAVKIGNESENIDQAVKLGHGKKQKISHVCTTAAPPLDNQPGHSWNFKVEYHDHFETPLIAYKDISVILSMFAARIGKSLEDLILYDPYFCKGRMIQHLNSLGYMTVINRNRDFYKDIASNKVPGKILSCKYQCHILS